ncbi:MAG: flippase-like domain-containing protein [Candidatus Heimdallarchaeota archaeon]|nr:flippase-like domain-containing protein [Candidatus Heimdallarchaeota archaeon]MCK5142512.1 flippase-like domain-containing protein [Candidatus Heimdallarchaeota archaeon]
MKLKASIRKYIFRFLVIAIMVGTLLYFFLTLDVKGSFSLYKTAVFYLLILALLFMIISAIVKAYRFYILIKPSSPDLKFVKFLIPYFVGYGFSVLGPFKTGEIASVEINKRSLDVPRSSSLAALAFFRIVDMFVVLVFFIIALGVTVPEIINYIEQKSALLQVQSSFYYIKQKISIWEFLSSGLTGNIQLAIQIVFYIAIVGTVILTFILFFPPVGRLVLRIIVKITGKISTKGKTWLENKVVTALDDYYNSLKLLYTKKMIATMVVVTTVFRWILEFYSLKFTLMAFGGNISLVNAASVTSITLLVGLLTFVPAGLGTGTITTQTLFKGLSISPIVAGATIIFQTLIGTGLTLSTAAISSIFLKEKKTEVIGEEKELSLENSE